MNDREETGISWRVWAGVIGLCVAGVLGSALVLLLISRVWYAWGLLGAFLIFGAVAVVFGYIFDRREANRRRGLADY